MRLFFQVTVAIFAVMMLGATLACGGVTLHVSVQGNDEHEGTVQRPLATLQRAVERLSADPGQEATIVLHAGAYYGLTRVGKAQGADLPRWTITAAARDGGFEEVLLDGSMDVQAATPLQGSPGVFQLATVDYTTASIEPHMWELDTRVRYTYAADLRGVIGRPATFFHDGDKQRLYFRTSDGKSPGEHRIGLQRTGVRAATRLWIQRDRVTVRGLQFANSASLSVDASECVVEDCRAFNTPRAINIHPEARSTRVSRLQAVDVATGVMSHGNDTLVEDSTILRPLDRFTIPLYTQDQSGIQFYAPAVGGRARRNVVVGFNLGIFMKGVKGTFQIENNTVIGPGPQEIASYGIFHVSGWGGSDVCRGNVVSGFYMPAPSQQTFAAGFTHEGNCFWNGGDEPGLQGFLDRLKEAGAGRDDRIADPLLVDVAGGDYRVAATSPVVDGSGQATAGALPAAPREVAVRPAPVKAQAPTVQSTQPPKFTQAPVERSNRHGATLHFRTAEPCMATVRWGFDASCGNEQPSARRVERRYDSNVGNEFTLVDEPLSATEHWATIVVEPGEAKGDTLHYRVELVDAAGRQTSSEVKTLTLAGAARVWRVARNGNDAADGESAPLASVQAALDRALPGDRIVLADGLYSEPFVIRHGGVESAPLVIEAQNEHQALIDTDRDPAIHSVVQIESARHVTLRGLEFRWFHAYAIYAHQAQDLRLERCKFWNMHFVKGRRSGVGLFFTRGSDLVIDHCLFFSMNSAFDIHRSGAFTVTNNTAIRMTHRVAAIINAGPGRLRHNSFTFTGNYHFLLSLSPQQLEQFDSDYNNLAQYVDMSYAVKDQPTEQELAQMLQPSGDDASVYPLGNKGIVSLNGRETVPFFSRWQQKFGKDAHSVFAHPRYVDPRGHDFRVRPDSPNVKAGENGATIGAFEAKTP
jgi:hypothetical protein